MVQFDNATRLVETCEDTWLLVRGDAIIKVEIKPHSSCFHAPSFAHIGNEFLSAYQVLPKHYCSQINQSLKATVL